LLVAVCAEWHSARRTTVSSLIAVQGIPIAKHQVALNANANRSLAHKEHPNKKPALLEL
jgi:hypothetical protein